MAAGTAGYTQVTFSPQLGTLEEIDPDRVEAAQRILDNGSAMVYKSTRSGFSTSATLAALRSGKRVLHVAPTNAILEGVVEKAAAGESIQVLPNSFCPKLQEQVQKDKFLTQLPMPLPKCEECGEYKEYKEREARKRKPKKQKPINCPVICILESDKLITAVTYAKLEALTFSRGNNAKMILEKLAAGVDIVILDEAHTISLPAMTTVEARKEVKVPIEYPALAEVNERWLELNEDKRDKINQIEEEGRNGHALKHLSIGFENNNHLDFKQMVAAYHELYDLAIHRKERGIGEADIITLRDIIYLMNSSRLTITYIGKGEGGKGKVNITGNYWSKISALQRFLTDHVPHAAVFFVSGTLVEPYPGFFASLSGREGLEEVVFPDLNNTNGQMTIYPDTQKLDSFNFTGRLLKIIKRVAEICKEHPGEKIYVVAQNSTKAGIIKKELAKAMGTDAPSVDYYRSDKTMGIENNARICIAIGLAEVPANTFDSQALGKNDEERFIHSRMLRQQAVDSAAWQTVSRVKDPGGKEASTVYYIGVTADQLESVVTWGAGRKLVHTGFSPYGPKEIRRKPLFKVEVREQIEPPKIYRAEKTSKQQPRGARLMVKDYVLDVEEYNLELLNSRYEESPYINNIGTLCTERGFYNYPRDKSESTTTAFALCEFFAVRFDRCQSQPPNRYGGLWATKRRVSVDSLPVLLTNHVDSRDTLGFYQISPDNTVKWICFDFDDHDGTRGAERIKSDINKLLTVLKRYDLPPASKLEASGSRNSYHVWIFLLPTTKASVAYWFARSLAKEAGLKVDCKDSDCEVFPKQPRVTKDSPFGNLVKVPICKNWKSGGQSIFLDPDTFEPYRGCVPLPKLVHLRDMPELDEHKEVEVPPMKAVWAASTLESGSASSFDVVEYIESHGLRIKKTKQKEDLTIRELEECPFNPSHNRGEAAIFVRASGAIAFRCFHESCNGKDWYTLRDLLENSPEVHKKALQQIVNSDESLLAWLIANCEYNSTAVVRTAVSEVYEAYCERCQPCDSRLFGKVLKQFCGGHDSIRVGRKGVRVHSGLNLKQPIAMSTIEIDDENKAKKSQGIVMSTIELPERAPESVKEAVQKIVRVRFLREFRTRMFGSDKTFHVDDVAELPADVASNLISRHIAEKIGGKA